MSIIFGTESEFMSFGPVVFTAVATLDVSRFVVAYNDDSDVIFGAAKIGTVSGTTITFGAENAFPYSGEANSLAVATLDASKFVVIYKDVADSNHGTAIIGTVSGTTITFGAKTKFLSIGAVFHIAITTLDASKFVVTYMDNADLNHGTAKIGTVSGTTITFGDEAEFLSTGAAIFNTVATLDESKFVVVYQDGSDSNHGTAKIGTVSGTTITFGAETEFLSTGTANLIAVATLDASKFVVTYKEDVVFGHGIAKIGTVSGTTITFGDETKFLSIGQPLLINVATLDESKFVVVYQDGSDSNHGTAKIGTVNGTTITFGDEAEFLSTGAATFNTVATLDESKFVVVYQDGSDSNHGTAKIGTIIDSIAIRPLDLLLRTQDYYPQIIGTFQVLANTATIQVWDITNGQNTLISVANSGCYAIGDTGRWGWSTDNLPTPNANTTHYAYTMLSNLDERFNGQFVLDVPEGSKWFHPRNRNDFIRSI